MNRGIARLLASGLEKGRLCEQLTIAFAPPPAHDPIWRDIGAGQHAAIVRTHGQAMAQTRACAGTRDETANPVARTVGYESASARRLSPRAHRYVLSMDSVWRNGASAAVLMDRYDVILNSAERELSSSELSTLDYLASLTVASRSYWEQNLPSLWPLITAAAKGCGGLSVRDCGRGLDPVSYESNRIVAPFRLAAFTRAESCDETYSTKNVVTAVVSSDVGGGWGWAGALAMGVANAGTAGQAAAVASGTAFVTAGVGYLICSILE
jgi:hypothetical protein